MNLNVFCIQIQAHTGNLVKIRGNKSSLSTLLCTSVSCNTTFQGQIEGGELNLGIHWCRSNAQSYFLITLFYVYHAHTKLLLHSQIWIPSLLYYTQFSGLIFLNKGQFVHRVSVLRAHVLSAQICLLQHGIIGISRLHRRYKKLAVGE